MTDFNHLQQPAADSFDGQSAGTDPQRAEFLQDLRENFVRIAECSREASDHEFATAAATIVDLLTVAAMFGEDSATAQRADEIIAFCRDTALPAFAASNSAAIIAEVGSRWNESLLLLAREERFSGGRGSEWPDAQLSRADSESLQQQEWRSGNVVAGHAARVDLEDILATLEQRSPQDLTSHPRANAMPEHRDDEHRDVKCHAFPRPPEIDEAMNDPDMLAAYADDAQLCLAEMEAGLLSLGQGLPTSDILQGFCRQLHTLKGASGTVGLSRLATYLHQLESWIEHESGLDVSSDRLLECVDAIRAQLTALGISAQTGEIAPVAPCFSPVEAQSRTQTQDATSNSQHNRSGSGTENDGFVRVEASRLERLMDLLAEMVMLRNRKDTHLQSLRMVHEELNLCVTRTQKLATNISLSDAVPGTTISGTSVSTNSLASRSFPSSNCDHAAAFGHWNFLSRSLEEVAGDTAELGRSLQEIAQPLAEDNAAVSHLIGRFRQELMELRRQPINGLFQRLQRAIHDAAKTEGKQVEIRLEGQGARAERAIQERLFEPLLHLVRNAVSHGIQLESDRIRAGKPACGLVTLSAWSDAATLCVEVRDDGCGLNEAALEARGRELGLLPPGECMTPATLRQLIFSPGVSTKSTVSEISGRGVGMDVVANWVRRLRGRIDVESVSGKGTTFRLQVPLRSAVEHAMIVRAGGQLFALPMHCISGTADATRPQTDQSGKYECSEPIPLRDILKLRQGHSDRSSLVTVRGTHKRPGQPGIQDVLEATFAVDAIVGVEEVVVRVLPSLLQRNELFVGVTLSGRAESVLVLDAAKLIDLVRTSGAGSAPASDGSADSRPLRMRTSPVKSPPTSEQRCVLIVDDSLVVRRSLAKKLTAAGFAVREAGNGRDALAVLKSDSVATVITDIDMPGMDGIALLQEMKHQKQLRGIPVMVLSSRDSDAMPRELTDFQPSLILTKPVTDETISAILGVVGPPTVSCHQQYVNSI